MFKLFLILITVPRDQKSMTVPYPWVETDFAFNVKHKYQVGLLCKMVEFPVVTVRIIDHLIL